MALTYLPGTEQFQHQSSNLEVCWDKPGYAWFWEQGTGKTKQFIDNTAALADAGEITGDFMIAPNGLHRNYITRELPKHMPGRILDRSRSMFWRTDKGSTKWHQEEARHLLAHKGHTSLAMSYDALLTDKGKALAKEYLTSRRVIYGADEAHRIKNPESDRGALAIKSATFAPYRRVMTGTPSAGLPWDMYAPMKFCDVDFWSRHGIGSFKAAQTAFGVWGTIPVRIAATGKKRWGVTIRDDGTEWRDVPTCLQYKDLDILNRWISPGMNRVLKADVFDLPPKVYSRKEFELSTEQRLAYDSLKDLGFAMVDGAAATSTMGLTTMLRLQQISCGYLPTDPVLGEDAQPVHRFKHNPRADLLRELVRDVDGQFLIWARFNLDIDLICEMLAEEGITFGRYDGCVTDEECWDSEARFHSGDAQGLVLNAAKGSEGLTLTEARTAFVYSMSYKFIERMQLEDRNHRYGTTGTVNYIDLVGVDTMDDEIIDNLQGKFDTSGTVLGDKIRSWIGAPMLDLG